MVSPLKKFLRRSPNLYEKIKRSTNSIDVEDIWVKDATILKYMIGKLPDYNKGLDRC